MTQIGNFLRNYNFMGLTKTVADAQSEVCQQPNKNWQQMAGKMGKNVLLTSLLVGAQFAEIPTYIAVSGLRWCRLFTPPLPQPPAFALPHSNAEFMDNSVKRALWDWKPGLKNEMMEGIGDGLSDKWNVFQVVAEWCLANSFEHPSYSKPTFLTASEALQNGQTFGTVAKAFSKLWESDKNDILDAVYHQTEIKSVSSAGKKVYQDLRALASKLTQGNQAFLSSFKELMEKTAAAEPASVSVPLSARTTAAPQSAANVPNPASLYPAIAPAPRYEPYVPTMTPVPSAG